MQELAIKTWETIIAGGATAVIAILLAVIAYFVWERIQLFASIKNYRKMLNENRNQYGSALIDLIDKYHLSNTEIAKALTEIKVVLATINKTLI